MRSILDELENGAFIKLKIILNAQECKYYASGNSLVFRIEELNKLIFKGFD